MSNNNSDYSKPRTNLVELLPEVYRSDTNRALFENLFNRFLTKQETKRVAGYVGKGNPNAIIKRQIQEPTVHRQGYQLQPILYDKIGSVEWMSSWYDLLNEAERLGIDKERMQEWLDLVVFNWAPPIDIDKLIHYQDYYWYDSENPSSRPQYITIRNRCTTTTALVNFHQNLIDEFGATIPTVRAVPVSGTIPQFDIYSIDSGLNQIIVEGNVVAEITDGQYFRIYSTASNDGIYQVSGVPIYNNVTGRTTITVLSGSLTTNESSVGVVIPRRFDKLVITGEYIRLLEPGFVFFYKNSSNSELNSTFWTVVESDYNSTANETTIKIDTVFTNDVVDGVISQEEKLATALAARDCQCTGSTGWDIHQWDDNPLNPLWDGDHTTLLSTITNAVPPSAPGTDGELWWDQSSDRLYQYSTATSWVVLWNNFSSLTNDTVGQAYWDYSPGCGVLSAVPAAEQWILQNKWLHRNDVPNFSIAKQAKIPIIEYEWDLELNEWTYTPQLWKYRDNNYSAFVESSVGPELIELLPLDHWTQSGNEIVLDVMYGDLTSYFTPGKQFKADNTTSIFEVEYSTYVAPLAGSPRQTKIKLTVPLSGSGLIPAVAGSPYIVSTTPLIPSSTSNGDWWIDYNVHWVYAGQGNTVPVVHQPDNDLIAIPVNSTVTVATGYEYMSSAYALEATVLTTGLTTIDFPPHLRTAALLGFNDIRVYVNEIRQYGTYDENDGDGDGYVTEIIFLPSFECDEFDKVRIEVGEASMLDIGWASIPVRVDEDNVVFSTNGPQVVSLVEYRKEEQVKSEVNQYPLFDIYNVDGSPAFRANPIFSFLTDQNASVNPNIGMRLATDSAATDYMFQQHLVDSDGTMYAYRDYANSTGDIWVNPVSHEVLFWTGSAWSDKVFVGNYYTSAIISDIAPGTPWNTIDGMYWYDTLVGSLKQFNLSTTSWEVVSAIYAENDNTLQTIWKKGLNDERYIPEKRDWETRSLAEYNEQKEIYVDELSDEYVNAGTPLLEAQAQAETEWANKQSNHLSPSGDWVGDWEIPDPLYYNVSHENRQVVSFRELLTHFNTIIQAQPKIPGFTGPQENMFHLIPSNEVNFGLGGKIHEYSHGFDTFLSSLFINTISPRALYEFAHDQYEVLLNNIKELLRRNAVELFTTVDTTTLTDQTSFVVDSIIDAHEQNDNLALLYGDSTTFTEVNGVNDLGIRNWIATLPYLGMVAAQQPFEVVDIDNDVNQIVHHDGHRTNYLFEPATIEGIIRAVVNTPDERTRYPGPSDPPTDTFGHISTSVPPNNTTEFESTFTTTIVNRSGVYWYRVVGTDRTLYRLNLAGIGLVEPSSSLADGAMWLDLTPGLEVLRIKQTNPNTGITDWNVVDGLSPGTSPIRLHNGTNPLDLATATVSAWQEVSLDDMLRKTVLEVENRLYENVPFFPELKYDIQVLAAQYPQLYEQLMEEAFLSYVNQQEIILPYANDEYTAADPFTWNYRYSSPGQSYQIVEANSVNGTFKIQGNVTASFGANVQFHIKNSGVNDGFWKTGALPSSFDGTHTTIYVVNRPVADSLLGVIYTGLLPSAWDPIARPYNWNDGSESGGYWKDLYQKLLQTPYPHLEPWALQGYTTKPTWWDTEYLNDDSSKWGDRRWKYKHGFEIVGVDNTADVFEITGDFCEVFPVGVNFTVDSSPTVHEGVWQVSSLAPIVAATTGIAGLATIELPGNLVSTFPAGARIAITDSASPVANIKAVLTINNSIFTGPPLNRTIISFVESVSDVTDFDLVSGVVYLPTTNRTKIYIDTTVPGPSPRNDIIVSTPSGRIIKAVGMWENIRTGAIPAGRPYPNGIVSVTGIPSMDFSLYDLPVTDLPTFDYFGVNIGNTTITTGGTFHPDDVLPPYWNYIPHFGVSLPPTFDRPIRSVYTIFTEVVAPGAGYTFGDAGPVEWEWRNSSQALYDQLTIAFQLDPVRFTHTTFGPEFYYIGGLPICKCSRKVLSHTSTVFHGDIVNNTQMKYNGTNQWYVNFARYVGLDLSMSDFRSQWTLWTTPLMYQFASFIDTPSLDVTHRNICISEFDYRIAAKRSPGVEDYWLDSFQAVMTNIPPKLARYDNDYDWGVELRTKSTIGKSINYYGVRNYQFYADPNTNICSLYTWEISGVDILNNTFSIGGDQTLLFTTGRTFDVTDSTANNGTYTTRSAAYNVVTNQTIISTYEDVVSIAPNGFIKASYRTLPWVTGDRVVLSTHETLPVPLQGDNVNGVYEYFIIIIDNTHFKLARTRTEALANTAIDITSTGRDNHFVGQIATTFKTSKTTKNWRHYVVDKGTVLEFTPPYDIRGLQTVVDIVDGYEAYTKDQGWRVNSDNSLKDFDSPVRFVNWQLEVERFIDYVQVLRDVRQKVDQKFEATIDVTTDVWTFAGSGRPQFITGDPVGIYVSGNVYPTPLARGLRYYMIRDSISQFRLAATKADAEAGVAIDITSIAGVDQIFITEASNLMKNRPTFEINPFRNGIWFRPEHGIVSNLLSGPADDMYNTQLLLDQYSRAIGSNVIKVFRQDKETQISIANDIPNDIQLTSIFEDPYNYIHLAAIHLFVDTYEHVLIFNNETSEGQLLYDPFVGLNVTKYELLFNRQVEFTQRPNVGGQYLSTVFNQGADLRRNFEASVEDLRLLYDTYQVSETNPLIEFSRKSIGYEGRRDYLDNININSKSQFIFWKGQIQNKGSVNSVDAFVNSRRFIDAKLDEFWAVKIAEFGSAAEKEYISMWLSADDIQTNELRLHFLPYDSISGADTGFTPIALSDTGRWYNQPDQLERLRDNGGSLYFEMKPTAKFVVDPQVGSPINPRVRHNTMSDLISVTTKLYEDGYMSIHPSPSATLTIDPYIPGTNSIGVFGDGVSLVEGTDYNEVTGAGLTSTTIELIGSPLPNTVNVVHKTTTLIEGTHFTRINSNIVEFVYPEILASGVTIWGWTVDESSLNPAKIIDKKSETVVTPVQIWDPARGHHYYNGIHIVDLQRDTDPAIYNNTPRLNTQETDSRPDPWNHTEVGTTWLDTSNISYVPYYDEGTFSNVEDRIRLWGRLADWAEVKIRTWVESDIPPAEWNEVASEEEGNASIPEDTRRSGRIYPSLFEKDGGSPTNWILLKDKREYFDVAIEGTGAGTNTFTLSTIPAGQLVNVYVNGQLQTSNVLVSPSSTVTVTNLALADRVCVELPVPTDENFIVAQIEAGNLLREYEYTTRTVYDNLNIARTKYYFWIENKTTRGGRTMPPSEAQETMVEIPIPYVFFQKPEDAENIVFGSVPAALPTRFTQAVIRGLRNIVNDELRYVVRWTRDFTLRDTLASGETSLQKKTLHEQWQLLRREQLTHIPRWLWNKVTEAIVGYKLNDSTTRVPSYERELFDTQNGTDTQYGLRDGQAMVSGQLALATILADLNNPKNSFVPVDINVFFENHNFDTPEEIIDSMDTIYNTFANVHVNRMFFDVLLDGLSLAGKYEDIFKTSMVALHGIRPFQIGGLFDD